MQHKRRQKIIYISGVSRINPPAAFSTTNITRKATKDEHERYLDALNEPFKIKIKQKINEHKKRGSLGDLYSSLLQITQLSRGVVSNAEHSINAPVNSIVFLNGLTKRTKRKSIELWRDYVAENFRLLKDAIVTSEGSRSKDVDDDEKILDEADDAGDDTLYRACSSSFVSMIRSGLSTVVRDAFLKTIGKTIADMSDNIADFSKQVLKMILIFSDNRFVAVEMVHKEQKILNSLLPEGYAQDTKLVPAPMDRSFLINDAAKKKYDELFQQSHLHLIHSTYFGPKGNY